MTTKPRTDSDFAPGNLVALRSATFRTRAETPGICVRIDERQATKMLEVLFASGTLERFSLREADWYLDPLGAAVSPPESCLDADRTTLMLAYLEGRFDPQFESARRIRAERISYAYELEAVLAASG